MRKEKVSEMKSIMFIIASLQGQGGIERIAIHIANKLSERHHVSVIALRDDPIPVFELNEGISVYSLHIESQKRLVSKFSVLRRSKELKKIAIRDNITTVIGVGVSMNIYGYFLKFFMKTNWISWEHENFLFNKSFFVKCMRIMAAKKADAIVLLSDYDVMHYKAKYHPKKKCVKISNSCFSELPVRDLNREKIILGVGHLWKVKQFDKLIDAWSILESKYPDWKVCIAGEGSEREKIELRIKEKNLMNVELMGFQKDVYSLYSRSAIFVMTSTYEGFSLATLEAQSFGLPTVCFLCEGGLSEIIIDKQNGFFVPMNDTKMLAKTIEKLISSPELYNEMSNNALKLSKRFCDDVIIEKWEAII